MLGNMQAQHNIPQIQGMIGTQHTHQQGGIGTGHESASHGNSTYNIQDEQRIREAKLASARKKLQKFRSNDAERVKQQPNVESSSASHLGKSQLSERDSVKTQSSLVTHQEQDSQLLDHRDGLPPATSGSGPITGSSVDVASIRSPDIYIQPPVDQPKMDEHAGTPREDLLPQHATDEKPDANKERNSRPLQGSHEDALSSQQTTEQIESHPEISSIAQDERKAAESSETKLINESRPSTRGSTFAHFAYNYTPRIPEILGSFITQPDSDKDPLPPEVDSQAGFGSPPDMPPDPNREIAETGSGDSSNIHDESPDSMYKHLLVEQQMQLTEMQELNHNLEHDLALSVEKLTHLQEERDDFRRQLKALQAQHVEMRQDIQQVSLQERQGDDESEELKKQNITQLTQIARLQAHNQKLINQLMAHAETPVSASIRSDRDFSAQTEEWQELLHNAQARLDEAEASNTRLEQELMLVREALAAAQLKQKEEADANEENAPEMDVRAAEYAEAEHLLKEELAKTQNERETLRSELEMATQKLSVLSLTQKKTLAQLDELDRAYVKLSNNYADAATALEICERTVKNKDTELEGFALMVTEVGQLKARIREDSDASRWRAICYALFGEAEALHLLQKWDPNIQLPRYTKVLTAPGVPYATERSSPRTEDGLINAPSDKPQKNSEFLSPPLGPSKKSLATQESDRIPQLLGDVPQSSAPESTALSSATSNNLTHESASDENSKLQQSPPSSATSLTSPPLRIVDAPSSQLQIDPHSDSIQAAALLAPIPTSAELDFKMRSGRDPSPSAVLLSPLFSHTDYISPLASPDDPLPSGSTVVDLPEDGSEQHGEIGAHGLSSQPHHVSFSDMNTTYIVPPHPRPVEMSFAPCKSCGGLIYII